MKYMQASVPGRNKITGKAGMLDESINYVQSLQRQVEFLSMKLATVSPRLDFDIDNLYVKEVFPLVLLISQRLRTWHRNWKITFRYGNQLFRYGPPKDD
ncbi:hypothetical protein HRI_000043200 [Hibiscus trionum]|uniref:BHLH domain-containing protein n=1 Tax=Hibiscus trionum TaxID=183268 RepID=A0A9W7LH18_HIBTR|nr:hypothetical protein HRI_000043200 [Hibiscus trionum]